MWNKEQIAMYQSIWNALIAKHKLSASEPLPANGHKVAFLRQGDAIPALRICFLLLFFCAFLSGCGLMKPATDKQTPIAAQKVVKTAYSQVGAKYRPGGASPGKGFDCSGLIWWAYKQHGLQVPRLTVDQAKSGQAVPRGRERPGDIVVFRTSQSPRGLHTGLYAGGNAFIHSPRSGERVRMESITVPYWRSKLVAVRRVVR
jgi:cell wall-associated NlpC family hydrolase